MHSNLKHVFQNKNFIIYPDTKHMFQKLSLVTRSWKGKTKIWLLTLPSWHLKGEAANHSLASREALMEWWLLTWGGAKGDEGQTSKGVRKGLRRGCGFLSKNGGACNANWWLLKCFWSELCWVLWNGEREGKGCLLSCVEVVPWGRIFCLFWVEKGCGFCLWKLRFKEELWCLFGSGGWNGMMIEKSGGNGKLEYTLHSLYPQLQYPMSSKLAMVGPDMGLGLSPLVIRMVAQDPDLSGAHHCQFWAHRIL